MEKLKIIEQDGKRIDIVIECPKRFSHLKNATGRIERIDGEFQFIPRGNNLFAGTRLSIDELSAIINKLKELNK